MTKACQFFAVLFAAIILSGCKSDSVSTASVRTTPKAIDVVIDQFNLASVQCTNSMNELMKSPINNAFTHKAGGVFQKYHDDLVAIDISGCPEDFRLAFIKYYQAVLGSKTYADSITGWNGILKGMANGIGALFNMHDNTDKAVDPLVKAGNEFELVCTKYNVSIK